MQKEFDHAPIPPLPSTSPLIYGVESGVLSSTEVSNPTKKVLDSEKVYGLESGLPSLPIMTPEQEVKLNQKKSELDASGVLHLDLTISYQELQVAHELGRGAYATVYYGKYEKQTVAIKKFHIESMTKETLTDLRKEAKIMVEMSTESEHIVRLKKICVESPNYALVMEYMPFGSLYNYLQNSKNNIGLLFQYKTGLDVSRGLHDLHTRRILHRDLKSLNILLNKNLKAKLTDFGLAKIKQETLSQTGGGAGTPRWMAPELFNGSSSSKASDIYSLGMVLWELVTREIPFKNLNNLQAMAWIKAGNREILPKDCPEKLKTLIQSCWDTPEKRPTAREVADCLSSLYEAAHKAVSGKEVRRLTTEIEQLKRVHQQEVAELKAENSRLTTEIEQLKQQLAQPKEESKLSLSISSTVVRPFNVGEKSTAIGVGLFSPVISKTPEAIQNQLIDACKTGDAKAVAKLLKKGAKPEIPNSKDEAPLGAAVWSMNLDVVDLLLKQMGGVSLMTWEACETHNMKHYGKIFVVPAFQPSSFKEYYPLLEEIESVAHIKEYHLQQVPNSLYISGLSSWVDLKKFVTDRLNIVLEYECSQEWEKSWKATEIGYTNFTKKIKERITTAQPTAGMVFQSTK